MTKYFLFLFVALAAMGCKKDEPPTVPADNSYYVDEILVNPTESWGDYDTLNASFSVRLDWDDPDAAFMSYRILEISCRGVSKGTYDFSEKTFEVSKPPYCKAGYTHALEQKNGIDEVICSTGEPTTKVGEITITEIDRVNKHVTGTFWFDATEESSGRVAHVRNGKFNFYYQ